MTKADILRLIAYVALVGLIIVITIRLAHQQTVIDRLKKKTAPVQNICHANPNLWYLGCP